jgi:hypothetical protein
VGQEGFSSKILSDEIVEDFEEIIAFDFQFFILLS